jgi:hypothetical protein
MRVEIAADFTDWKPVELMHVRGDRWRLDFLLTQGVYRINVRIDGQAWIVPRGITVQDDEFGGHIGLLVVQ